MYDQYEAVARDGWLEIRSEEDDERWLAIDTPVDVKA